jgi:hypothetical protein
MSVFAAAPSPARASTIYGNGAPNQANGSNISGFVTADDFTLSSAFTLTGLTFWASANFDPFSGEFSGTIGWAILSDILGLPDAVLFFGSDAAPVLTDTGVDILGTREWRIDVALPSINLAAGTYWLALREGDWGSANDGSTIYWNTTGNTTGALPLFTADLTGASGWTDAGMGTDLAFQLQDDDSAVVPEPSAFFLTATALLGLLAFAARKRGATCE